jgi:hypothetical protein
LFKFGTWKVGSKKIKYLEDKELSKRNVKVGSARKPADNTSI